VGGLGPSSGWIWVGISVCVSRSDSWGTGSVGVAWHKAIVGARKTSKATAVGQFLNRTSSSRAGEHPGYTQVLLQSERVAAWACLQLTDSQNGSRRSKWFTGRRIWRLNGRCEASHIFGFTTAPSDSLVQDWGGAAFWLALCQAGRRALRVVRALCWHGQLNS